MIISYFFQSLMVFQAKIKSKTIVLYIHELRTCSNQIKYLTAKGGRNPLANS